MAADASDYPTSADSIPRTSPSDNLTGHSDLHDKMADAIEEIQGFVGVSGDTTAGTVVKRITDLEGKDITVTFDTGSDLDGSFTITNLGNVTNTTVSVRDDSHNHVISNVDGLQSALDGKQPAGSYQPAGTYLTPNISGTLVRINSPAGLEIETNGGQTNGLEIYQPTVGDDAAMMFHVNSQYAVLFGLDGYTGELYVGGWSKGANRYKMWHEGNFSPSSYLTTSGTAADSELLDGNDSSAFARSSGRQSITGCGLTGTSYTGASIVLDATGGSQPSLSFPHYWSGTLYGPQLRLAQNIFYFRDKNDGDGATISVNKIESRNPSLNSSRTIKHDIEAFTGDATSIVDGLETVTFRYNDGDTEQQHLGFIAEDVATVFPMAVDQSGDTPTLNIAHIIALSVAGLQEANTRIAELEAKVAELEGR
jgi:hypothetical protein